MRHLGLATLAFAPLLLLACRDDDGASNQGAGLVLSLQTIDIVVPTDTNLVGLYIGQIDGSGAEVRHDAYEAAPLMKDGKLYVPFPATMALARGERTERVHVRLVAFRGEAREVLSMREARVSVPSSDVRLLPLRLLWTDRDNVKDTDPGAPLTMTQVSVDGAVTMGKIEASSFKRFVSQCDGGDAPEGKTAGDDGHCVSLDLEEASLRGLSGEGGFDAPSAKGFAQCMDVEALFRRGEGSLVKRVAAPSFEGEGCSLDLPEDALPDGASELVASTEEPGRQVLQLNLGVVSDVPLAGDNFTNQADYQGKQVRPLVASTYEVSGTRLTFPAATCAVLKSFEAKEILLSSRAPAWQGQIPACSEWVFKDGQHQSAPDALPMRSEGDNNSSSSGGSSSGGPEPTLPTLADLAAADEVLLSAASSESLALVVKRDGAAKVWRCNEGGAQCVESAAFAEDLVPTAIAYVGNLPGDSEYALAMPGGRFAVVGANGQWKEVYGAPVLGSPGLRMSQKVSPKKDAISQLALREVSLPGTDQSEPGSLFCSVPLESTSSEIQSPEQYAVGRTWGMSSAFADGGSPFPVLISGAKQTGAYENGEWIEGPLEQGALYTWMPNLSADQALEPLPGHYAAQVFESPLFSGDQLQDELEGWYPGEVWGEDQRPMRYEPVLGRQLLPVAHGVLAIAPHRDQSSTPSPVASQPAYLAHFAVDSNALGAVGEGLTLVRALTTLPAAAGPWAVCQTAVGPDEDPEQPGRKVVDTLLCAKSEADGLACQRLRVRMEAGYGSAVRIESVGELRLPAQELNGFASAAPVLGLASLVPKAASAEGTLQDVAACRVWLRDANQKVVQRNLCVLGEGVSASLGLCATN